MMAIRRARHRITTLRRLFWRGHRQAVKSMIRDVATSRALAPKRFRQLKRLVEGSVEVSSVGP